MASAGSRSLPKMAAGGRAAGARGRGRGRGCSETRGPALPGRQRQPGRCAKGSPECGRPAIASAQPAEEEPPPARRQQRGGPRTPSPCSSNKAAGRQPSKRLKCEKSSLVKLEQEGLICGDDSESLAALRETPKTSDGDESSEDPGGHNIIQQKKCESIPETNEDKKEEGHDVSLKPHAVESSSAPSKIDSDEHLDICSEEEGSCESVFSDGSSLEDADVPGKPIQLDSSAFLNEDSNQPMPVARFFGDECLQDLPAAALPRTILSRREFRKLHFIAKEDEEEEEEEDVVQQ